MMELNLSRSVAGKTVLVTGAASGMGRATAQVFAAEGANVAVTDLHGPALEQVAADLAAQGYSAKAWALDVSDHAAIRSVVDDVAATFGGLDAVVNNAGISAFCSIDDDGYDLIWDRAVTVLLTAHQRIIRAALPHLRQSSSPRIVNIASTEALGATSRDSPYCAAKAGVTGLTRALAVELGREGITVNAVNPGLVASARAQAVLGDDGLEAYGSTVPVGRAGTPVDIARACLFLASPVADYITGTTIKLDGGSTIAPASGRNELLQQRLKAQHEG